jgi:hypothetical protein
VSLLDANLLIYAIHADAPQRARRDRDWSGCFVTRPVLVGRGGSIPAVEAIKLLLGMDALLLGFGLADDRVHSPNEKFELRCCRNRIRTHATLLAELARLS